MRGNGAVILLLLLLFCCGCREQLATHLRKLPVSGIHDSGEKLVLLLPGKRMVLHKESSAAIINSVAVQLYEPVQKSGECWELAENSVENILLPVLSEKRFPVRRILIDPGHGGKDTGAVSAGGIKEKDLNLALAAKLCTILHEAGFICMMTRTDDTALSLDARSAMIKRVNADLFISIHHNSSATNPKASGMETFALKALTPEERIVSRASHRLAYLVQLENSGTGGTPGRGVKHARFKVLRQSAVPAILMEAGFMSNADEVQRCASADWQQKMALAAARAVMRFASGMEKSGF